LSFAFKQSLPVVWLVGGSGKLGRAISELLQHSYNVLCISRSHRAEGEDNPHHYKLDLSNEAEVQRSIEDLKTRAFPRGIVFCQRYRPDPKGSEIDVMSALHTEILSPQKIIEETCKSASRGPLSIVLVSSVAGYLINTDIPFWYHWIKSSQIHLTKYYSLCKRLDPFNINCIAAGTFLKAPFETYPASYRTLLDAIQTMNASRKMCTVQDIANIVEFLISDRAMCVNGQIITPDGGLTNRLQEGLIQNDDYQKR
jgi:NAD(P)-dependent dehydrogenase (short-subunit alcohol dehydrogenase family)